MARIVIAAFFLVGLLWAAWSRPAANSGQSVPLAMQSQATLLLALKAPRQPR